MHPRWGQGTDEDGGTGQSRTREYYAANAGRSGAEPSGQFRRFPREGPAELFRGQNLFPSSGVIIIPKPTASDSREKRPVVSQMQRSVLPPSPELRSAQLVPSALDAVSAIKAA